MKVIAGQASIDDGEVFCQKNIQVAHYPRKFATDITGKRI